MANEFTYDVFLSHSRKDKTVVRDLAERLRKDGLRVWFDEWEILPGDSIPAKIEEGLEHSRVLVLCMSAHAFGSDWPQLEAGTFRFRDPQNKDRRFIPLRLDNTPIPGSLAQFSYISWLREKREQEYSELLEACRPRGRRAVADADVAGEPGAEKVIQLDCQGGTRIRAFSADRSHVLGAGLDNSIRLWDVKTGRCLRVFEGHERSVYCLAWSADERQILSGSADRTVRLWDAERGNCLSVDHVRRTVVCLAWASERRRVLVGTLGLSLLNLERRTVTEFEADAGGLWSVHWSSDRRRALSSSSDRTVQLWNVENRTLLRRFEGHSVPVLVAVWNADEDRVLSGSQDNTLRLWNAETGRCLRVLEGHTKGVLCVAWNADQRHALSGSGDGTVRLWDVEKGRCLRVLRGHTGTVTCVAWSTDGHRAYSADTQGGIHVLDLSKSLADVRSPGVTVPALPPSPDQVEYTNAKVLLVGHSSAGKTGLSNRLAMGMYKETDSTIGAWATQWKLPLQKRDGLEREIWLWDFGGQADQRLIHQLYLDQTQLAVLVFDPQKENLLDLLGTWNRELTRAATQGFQKLLVAGRIDAGGLRSLSKAKLEQFAKEHRFARYIETSAKENIGCDELKQAIIGLIDWDQIAQRTTPRLFRRLKEEIVRLKDEGRVLMRFNELREALTLRLVHERFTDDELRAVISLLAGPGVVWELGFGSWVLLQPELINSRAQAVIRSLREDEREIGCIAEEKVLNGDLPFSKDAEQLPVDEERIVLLAMHRILVKRGLCLREEDPEGRCSTTLVFPSFVRRERPELVEYPSVIVTYQFSGFLDDIYATLVVRLHHTDAFERDQLWREAADFKTVTDKRLGVKMTRRADGAGELEVYFDPDIPVDEMIIFSKYVHEHLLKKAREVVRLRHYVCSYCQTPVENRDVAMRRVREKGKKATIICVECEKRVKLWDELEERFADPQVQRTVRELEDASRITLDNESKERALVGDVISTVAVAGQISRELTVSDHGIDMEIEFKDDAGEATGRKVYLQLKSGDSYLTTRKSDSALIFQIRKQRHARYWCD